MKEGKMFSSIKTASSNRDIIAELTRQLGLGSENVIARLAMAYSLSKDAQLDINQQQDAQGKEYSRKILLGEYDAFYIALVCQKYKVYKTDRDIDIPQLIKLHLDKGLLDLYYEINFNKNKDGITFLVEKVEESLST
jgi:DNA sulfur modification protein DndE